ncbi:acyl-CoA thioesterase [Syntrophotalea carbinolica DSM 2380]|uniref:Acyl-CoA thioesterase n=1 Tax=Syntrophotalea carbinolica (strain DSM 2380 / NBRC 103641 / GraBd1) TaxID=338963 RepID=Q3A167_SYNC1|nr:acyl-CoA thioesterase [Syntrophotalea carbinolica]ABA89890.1 acyl-CoA thioesterase [Syntrophotalea carbinolica DSM 2380]
MRKPYFPQKNGPSPLCHSVERRVRFEEVDPLGIVWHGRYASYFEDARVAHGDHFGIGYLDFYKYGITTPIKQFHVDYAQPLIYGETYAIEARLHWTEAARLNYEFCITDAAGDVLTRGYSVQLMVDEHRELLVFPPDFYVAFLESWRSK